MKGWNADFSRFYTHEDLRPVKGADLRAWSSAANMLFGPDNIAQGVILLSSFAAPLWALMSRPFDPGFVMTISGWDKAGKSTAMAAAASVWGPSEPLTILPTDNGVDRWVRITRLRHFPVIASTLVGRDPEVMKQIYNAFILGPSYLSENMKSRLRSPDWRTVMLIESRMPIYQALGLKGLGDSAGVWGIGEMVSWIPAALRHPDPHYLEKTFQLNAGLAGVAYVDMLNEKGMAAYIRRRIRAVAKDLAFPMDDRANWYLFTQRQRFLAAVVVAAELVTELGLIEMSVPRLMFEVRQKKGLLMTDRNPPWTPPDAPVRPLYRPGWR